MIPLSDSVSKSESAFYAVLGPVSAFYFHIDLDSVFLVCKKHGVKCSEKGCGWQGLQYCTVLGLQVVDSDQLTLLTNSHNKTRLIRFVKNDTLLNVRIGQ